MKHLVLCIISIAVLIAAMLIGCAAVPVKECPACPDVAQRCLPAPAPERVFCHMKFFYKVGDEFEPVFIPTECDPKCVDGDGIKIEPCP